jgi:arylsulfatase A-like enzyme
MPSAQLDGANIASLLTFRAAPSPHDELILFINDNVAAIRTQRWKYVVRSHYRTYEAALDAPERTDWAVLVDMQNDPEESFDVSSLHPAVLADLAARLQRARDSFGPLARPPA